VAEEIDCGYLRQFSHEEVMPYINAYRMGDKTVYLMANGSMLNLTAGFGDSLNAFDVTLAVMASGIHHIVTDGMNAEANVICCRRASGKKRCKSAKIQGDGRRPESGLAAFRQHNITLRQRAHFVKYRARRLHKMHRQRGAAALSQPHIHIQIGLQLQMFQRDTRPFFRRQM
jgi:hypothetical protein